MPSRQLIYVTVFGTAMRPLAEACVQSLRAGGRLRGTSGCFATVRRWRRARSTGRSGRGQTGRKSARRGIDLGLTLPFARYDAIAYVDADCLSTAPVNREPDAYRLAPLPHFWSDTKAWMLPAWRRWQQRHRRGAPARPDADVPRISAAGLKGRGVWPSPAVPRSQHEPSAHPEA
jgi:hypothetical protein